MTLHVLGLLLLGDHDNLPFSQECALRFHVVRLHSGRLILNGNYSIYLLPADGTVTQGQHYHLSQGRPRQTLCGLSVDRKTCFSVVPCKTLSFQGKVPDVTHPCCPTWHLEQAWTSGASCPTVIQGCSLPTQEVVQIK